MIFAFYNVQSTVFIEIRLFLFFFISILVST